MLKNARLLMTGLTGQLAGSIAAILAPHNEIYGLARYSKPGSKEAVEALGITPVVCDYTTGNFDGVPDDFDYVFHAAADVFPVDIEAGIKQNAEGTGLLLDHLRRARAWIYVSTSGVYWATPTRGTPTRRLTAAGAAPGSTPASRTAPAASPRGGRPVAVSHSPGTAEIARMNWSYGRASFGGMPVRVITRVAKGEPVPVNQDWEFVGCPIHEDDMAEHLEAFFDGAAVGGTVTNWGGDDAVRSSSSSRGSRSSSAPLTPSPPWTRSSPTRATSTPPGGPRHRPLQGQVAGRLPADHRGTVPRAPGAGRPQAAAPQAGE